jgi:hypothetical protein
MDTSLEQNQDLQIETEAEIEIESESSHERQHQEPFPHDSMVTVRLSEPPPVLKIDTSVLRKDQNNVIGGGKQPGVGTPDSLLADGQTQEEESPRITMMDPNGEVLSPTGSESGSERNTESRRESDSSEGSVDGGGVNWEELEKTEEQEPRDESSDDVSLNSKVSNTMLTL